MAERLTEEQLKHAFEYTTQKMHSWEPEINDPNNPLTPQNLWNSVGLFSKWYEEAKALRSILQRTLDGEYDEEKLRSVSEEAEMQVMVLDNAMQGRATYEDELTLEIVMQRARSEGFVNGVEVVMGRIPIEIATSHAIGG